jgi:Rps23 Pro-64 3,4-dihydroxylase Tpa1-like proline 4-hydroxylase
LVVDDFLEPPLVERLLRWAIDNESDFATSMVLPASATEGTVDTGFRRSVVFFHPIPIRQLFEPKMLSVVDTARTTLGMPLLPVTSVDLQVTASNDGDFFKCHNDNAHGATTARTLTFVYFLHREPKPYRGGHLRLFETTRIQGVLAPGAEIIDIEPVSNRLVFFASHLMHEVQLVECPSQSFGDSRFTVNGWFVTAGRSAAHALINRRHRQGHYPGSR